MVLRFVCPACGSRQPAPASVQVKVICRNCGAGVRRGALAQPVEQKVPIRLSASTNTRGVARTILPVSAAATLLLVLGILLGKVLFGVSSQEQKPEIKVATPKKPRTPLHAAKDSNEGRPEPAPVRPVPEPKTPPPAPEPEKPAQPLRKSAPPPEPQAEEASAPRESLLPTSEGKLLLPLRAIQALRTKAARGDAGWKAFKARLDRHLSELSRDAYQGSQLEWISDCALGYLVLKDRDPATAVRYADKALAYIKSALRDLQKSGAVTRQFLSRGDGNKRTFTLPHTNILPASFHVYLGAVKTTPVKRGATGGDPVGVYLRVLKVSSSPDGENEYQEGPDWKRNPNELRVVLDWSPSGKQPGRGQTYHVTTTSALEAKPVKATLNSRSFTLSPAPKATQAVFVEYVYGKQSPDGLGYQQTSAGDGGFNSILIDTSYPSRYLGKHVAMGLDWLDGYPGVTAALRTEAMDMLIRWSDYVRDKGYLRNSPGSNYGTGGYVSRVLTALTLARRHPAGPRLVKEVLAYRKKYVLPLLKDESAGLKGGFWLEGWSYGQLATQNLLLSGLALETAGLIPEAVAERRWAGEVIEHLVSAQSTAGTVYDGGDYFAYPAPFPGKELFCVLAATAKNRAACSHANYVLQKYPGKDSAGYMGLLYRDQSAPASFWSSLPLEHYAPGGGLLVARSDWGKTPTWMAFQLGNLIDADHQSFCPGQLQIKRGADDLLINASAPGSFQTNQHKSTYGNLVLVSDNGDKVQTYPRAMGVWYGSPGNFTRAYEAARDHVYRSGDYRAAYSPKPRPGSGGSVSELTRQVVYLRPNHFIVYDRVTTLKNTYPKRLQWHFLKKPSVDGDSFEVAVGGSKLFGRVFSSTPLKTSLATVKVGRASVEQLVSENASAAQKVRYITVFQTAAATASRADVTERVVSKDAAMEGARVGDRVVLFARAGSDKAPRVFSYRFGTVGTTHHLLTDLRPSGKYQIAQSGAAMAVQSATSAGTLSFTTPAGCQGVTVQEAH